MITFLVILDHCATIGDNSNLKRDLNLALKNKAFFNFFQLILLSAHNASNGIPSFSKNQYYGYSNNGYTESQSDSNEYDNCDCLKSNPLQVEHDTCTRGQDQDSFNSNRRSKRSAHLENTMIDWDLSSSLATLKNFNLNSVLGNNKVNFLKYTVFKF